MSRGEHLARTYWFDLLIALLAIVAMLDVALGRGSSGAPTTTLWFCLPALAMLVLPVFARRWFPFVGPAAYWLLAVGFSFVEPLLIPYPESLFPIGLAAAFLLGNLRDVRRAGLGLAIVLGAVATVVYKIPGHSVDELVFIPVDFAVASVPAMIDVSAYRIVQEALTNTLKHAAASRADVHVRYWPDELEVEIIDDGRGARALSGTSAGGLGLIGMRERAALHGGQLTAGPASGGGFAVRVKLPTPDGAR